MTSPPSPIDDGKRRFGALLQHYRQQAGLTQEALAERAGLSVRGLSDLERGVHATPRRDTLKLLLNALVLTSAERVALMEVARSPARTPPTQPGTGPPEIGTLPPLADPLIGRETDIQKITALLGDSGVRLATITGPGGTGKTRVAIEVGHARAETERSVTWVSLASARTADAALSMIAAALGFEDRDSTPLPNLLARTLQDLPPLLILDNMEQIPDIAPTLGVLLAEAPALTILATSRAPLRLRGEHRYQLAPLSLTPASAAAGVQVSSMSPAAELFVRRAAEIDHGFTLTPQNAANVEAICTRLDGLPLAIELAAARSGVLPPAALLDRLDHALPLLTSSPHNAPARQRTLRDAIAWSYDLLLPETRQVFRKLGVFMGGFTLATAEQLCSPSPGSPVLDHLQVLLEQSLVRIMPGTDPPRYMLLETIREFAFEQLEVEAEASAALAHHAHVMSEMVREQSEIIFTRDDMPAIRTFDAEAANTWLAVATLTRTPGGAGRAAELCYGLTFWWELRAKGREALPYLDSLVARRSELPPRTLANLLITASSFHNERGEDIAEHMAREAVQIHEGLHTDPDPNFLSMARARFYLAECLADPSERRKHLEIALEYARRGALVHMEPFGLSSLCLALGELGFEDDAVRAGTQGIALQEELGGRLGIGHAHSQLGHALRLLGRHADALPHMATAFRNFWEIGAAAWTAQSLEGIAACAVHAQDAERAAWIFGAASQLRLRSGWSTDQELFGYTAETEQALTETLGAHAFFNLQAAGAAASWQELHDFITNENAIQSV